MGDKVNRNSPAKVLVVDDVETNLILSQELLNLYGADTDTANSGSDAIEKVKNGQIYDLILMDYMMPVIDGIETSKRLRKLGYSGVIVALTGSYAYDEKRMLKNEFNDIISKPIELSQLDDCMKKYVNLSRPGQEDSDNPENPENPEKSDSPESPEKSKTINPKIMKVFRRDAEKAIAALRDTYEREDWKLFTTTAHAMKAALANVGEEEASALSSLLEKAGKSQDRQFITANVFELIKRLQDIVDRIPKEKVSESRDVTENTALLTEKLNAIKSACSDYDRKAAYAEFDLLKQEQWKPQTLAFLEEVHELLDLHSDFEKAEEKIDMYLRG